MQPASPAALILQSQAGKSVVGKRQRQRQVLAELVQLSPPRPAPCSQRLHPRLGLVLGLVEHTKSFSMAASSLQRALRQAPPALSQLASHRQRLRRQSQTNRRHSRYPSEMLFEPSVCRGRPMRLHWLSWNCSSVASRKDCSLPSEESLASAQLEKQQPSSRYFEHPSSMQMDCCYGWTSLQSCLEQKDGGFQLP